ncbi:hypothetical protein, partial [Micromonospora sp. NPDC048843]|uniref:hypothetical protein n=1 Tax=Micromonospora sp. NPDC048843 TaxID=3155389 RepID=UPI0033D64FDD
MAGPPTGARPPSEIAAPASTGAAARPVAPARPVDRRGAAAPPGASYIDNLEDGAWKQDAVKQAAAAWAEVGAKFSDK